MEKHKVKGIYTAPTAVLFLQKENPNSERMKKYDLSSLKIICMAGER
jgi:propionyl-CoA synthetase